MDTPRIARLKAGNYQFGCAGKHSGNGTKGCPLRNHHHHDEFCNKPTLRELWLAGIDPKTFKVQRRA